MILMNRMGGVGDPVLAQLSLVVIVADADALCYIDSCLCCRLRPFLSPTLCPSKHLLPITVSPPMRTTKEAKSDDCSKVVGE